MSFFISKKLEGKIDINDIDDQLNQIKENNSFEKTMSLKINDVIFEIVLFQNNKIAKLEIICPINLFNVLKKSQQNNIWANFYVAETHFLSFDTTDMIFQSFKKIDNFLLSVVIFIHNDKLRCL